MVTGQLKRHGRAHYGFESHRWRSVVRLRRQKRLTAAERREGAANAALTRDLEEQKAETDAFLQDAVERLTQQENIQGGLTLKVESRRGSWRRRTRTNRSSCAPSRSRPASDIAMLEGSERKWTASRATSRP